MATKKRRAKGRKRSQASKKTRKILKALGIAAVKSTGRAVKRGARATAERVTREEVVAVASRDHWKKDYPDPRYPVLSMKQAEVEEYEAIFDGGVVVPFSVWSDSAAPLEGAAREAAEGIHGPIVQSWTVTDIEPMNDAAQTADRKW